MGSIFEMSTVNTMVSYGTKKIKLGDFHFKSPQKCQHSAMDEWLSSLTAAVDI